MHRALLLFLAGCLVEAEGPRGKSGPADTSAENDTGASGDSACTPTTWYLDGDQDTFGDPKTTFDSCEPPVGYVADGTDCDDARVDVHPGATEVCDEADQDCDEAIDEDAVDATYWYADNDADGYGAAANGTLFQCDQPLEYLAENLDCDDDDATVHPDADERCAGGDENCDGEEDVGAVDADTWYADADGDGYGDIGSTTEACDQPDGFLPDDNDCDDTDADRHPAAGERCNELDDDCDLNVDEAAVDAPTWYLDVDGDGYGTAALTYAGCSAIAGYVAEDTDCDDTTDATYPGAPDACDAVDHDCDDIVDEDDSIDAATWYADGDGDGYGDIASTTTACALPEGYLADATDCDDTDADVSPGGVEYCGGADEDCDGEVDEGTAADADAYCEDADGDGYGGACDWYCVAPAGWIVDDSDCDDADSDISPDGTEICRDGIDQDCDGTPDSGCFPTSGSHGIDTATVVVRGSTAAAGLGHRVCAGGDYDGDGIEDVVSQEGEGGTYSLHRIPGDFAGSGAIEDVVLGTESYSGYVFGMACGADFDGDGLDDFIAAEGDALLFDGDGTGFGTLEGDEGLVTPEAGDFDGDGNADVAIITGDPDDLDVYLGPLSGTLTSADSLRIRSGAGEMASNYFAAGRDLDGDGSDDLAEGYGDTYVFYGPITSAGFVADLSDAKLEGVNPGDMISDASGDGLADLVVSAQGTVGYLVSEPIGEVAPASVAFATLVPNATGFFPANVGGPDFDADGVADLAVSDIGEGVLRVYFGPLAGSIGEDSEDVTFTTEDGLDLTNLEYSSIDTLDDPRGLGYDALVTGLPISDNGSTADAGAVVVLHGSD